MSEAPTYCVNHGGPEPGDRCHRQSWRGRDEACAFFERRRPTDVPGTPGHCHFPDPFDAGDERFYIDRQADGYRAYHYTEKHERRGWLMGPVYDRGDGHLLYVREGLKEGSWIVMRRDIVTGAQARYNPLPVTDNYPACLKALRALAAERGWRDIAGEEIETMEPQVPHAISHTVNDIAVDKIDASPYQPRRHFDEESLQELADNIKTFGVQQPIRVRPRHDSDRYELVMGERRLRASRLAGLPTIPALISIISEDEAAQLALIENLQRRDLDPLEEAHGYQMLLERGMTQTELAKKINRSQPSIANALRLLELPENVQQMISSGELTISHGKVLASWAKWPEVAYQYARWAVNNRISSKALESMALPSSVKDVMIKAQTLRELDSYIPNLRTRFKWHIECRGCDDHREPGNDHYCMNVACYLEKQKTAIEAEVSEHPRTGASGIPIPAGAIDFSVNTPPPGCEQTMCPKNVSAVSGHSGKLVPFCTDPTCCNKLKAAVTRNRKKAEREEHQAQLGQAIARIHGTNVVREMVIQLTWSFWTRVYQSAFIQKAAEAAGIGAEIMEPANVLRRQYDGSDELYALLQTVPVNALLTFALVLGFQEDIRQQESGNYSNALRMLHRFLATKTPAVEESPIKAVDDQQEPSDAEIEPIAEDVQPADGDDDDYGCCMGTPVSLGEGCIYNGCKHNVSNSAWHTVCQMPRDEMPTEDEIFG